MIISQLELEQPVQPFRYKFSLAAPSLLWLLFTSLWYLVIYPGIILNYNIHPMCILKLEYTCTYANFPKVPIYAIYSIANESR